MYLKALYTVENQSVAMERSVTMQTALVVLPNRIHIHVIVSTDNLKVGH